VTTFDGLLSGTAPDGVYVWPDAPVTIVAVAEGRTVAVLDAPTSKAEALDRLGEVLSFGSHYGHNLDALADCLRDIEEPTVVLWREWGLLALADPATYEVIVTILRERAAAGGFSVVLLGAGPEVDLPRLD
jgi:RNAse (barnase) inhibitor barstar